MKNPIIVIAGPTASGKTKIAVEIAKKFNGEVVNADSRTVYKEMDIATSKPSEEEIKSVPHHLFDVVNPYETFSLANYKEFATKAIEDIQKRKKLPILVGGTGLYIDAVVYDYNLAETIPDFDLRNELENLSTDELVTKLKEINPDEITKIDIKNRRRMIRAIEIAFSTNNLNKQKARKEKPQNILYLAVDVPREKLYGKIEERINKWLDLGLVEETKKLKEKYSFDLPAMTSIGYKEISEALDNKITLFEAINIMKQRTRNYAKRQLTWFKRNKDIIWIKNKPEAEKVISEFLKQA